MHEVKIMYTFMCYTELEKPIDAGMSKFDETIPGYINDFYSM